MLAVQQAISREKLPPAVVTLARPRVPRLESLGQVTGPVLWLGPLQHNDGRPPRRRGLAQEAWVRDDSGSGGLQGVVWSISKRAAS